MIECLKMHKENFDYCLGELIRESEEKDKEIERLNNKIKSIVYQCYNSDMSYEEFKQIWVNAMGKIYEPSQIDELKKELGVDKE